MKVIIGNKEIELILGKKYPQYELYHYILKVSDLNLIRITACKQSNATEITINLYDCYHHFYIRKFASKDIINNELHVDPADIINKFFIFKENKVYSDIPLSILRHILPEKHQMFL